MARTPFNDIQEITSIALIEVYEAIVGIDATLSVVGFTNLSTTPLNIDVYHNNGTDRLKTVIHLPGGRGREEQYYGLERGVVKSGDIIKVQADAATAFNLFIYGSEVSV